MGQRQISSDAISIINSLHNTTNSTHTFITSVKEVAKECESKLDFIYKQHINENNFRYFDIDSSRRNRVQYPLQSDFVIPYTDRSSSVDFFSSTDPVSLSFPSATGTFQANEIIGSTTVVLDTTSNSLNNYYVNNILDINSTYYTITAYNGTTHQATITPPLSAPITSGVTTYIIRKAYPSFVGILSAGSTTTQVILPITAQGSYAGSYIRFTSGVNSGLYRVITSYNSSTRVATLSTALPNVPGLDGFEIDSYSYDNAVTLRYSGSRTINQPISYVMQFLNMSIPNIDLTVGYGGRVNNYPFLYVHFYDETKHTETTMYGNNPAGTLATFRISIDATVASALNQPTPNFFVFNGNDFFAPQSFKFNPSDSIRFRVTLPTGEPLQFSTPDNFSPLAPNPFVQITACFGVRINN